MQLIDIKEKQKTLVLTGGGTAGHVWPHFALFDDKTSPLARAFEEGRVQVCYVGSHFGMERDLVRNRAPQWRYYSVSTGKLRRFLSLRNLTDPFRILLGLLQSIKLLYSVKASVVFSKGGYVSAPVVWAAWLLRIPVVIHESDFTPALTTRITLPFAKHALVSFEETKTFCPRVFVPKISTVGLPLRSSIFGGNRAEGVNLFHLNPSLKTLLIFGGSLGAEALNQKVIASLPILSGKYNFIHIVGKGKLHPVEGIPYYHQVEFLQEEMQHAYATADLALCRAGASSIFELAAARIPMILVPLGLHQSRGDQIENARAFERRGWAQILWEKDMEPENVAAIIDHAMQSLDTRRCALENSPKADAAKEIGNLLLALMTGKQ